MNCYDLLYFAKYSSDPVTQLTMRSNVCYELIYVKRDGGRIYFDGGQQNIEANEIIILPPNVKYRFEYDKSSECILIGFGNCNYEFGKTPAFFKDCDKHNITQLLDLMCTEFEGFRFQRKQMLHLLLNMTLISLFRYSKPSDDKKDVETDNFNYILRFMDAQSQNGIDIGVLAKMSGLSYHRFRHKFKELIGISPQQYIIKQRLNFAKRMLETTKYSTSVIAAACDFRSVPQFITCFNRQEGLTPMKYRKLCKNNKE